MYVCVYIYIYIYVYICICICVCIYVYVYIYIYTHTHINIIQKAEAVPLLEASPQEEERTAAGLRAALLNRNRVRGWIISPCSPVCNKAHCSIDIYKTTSCASPHAKDPRVKNL